MQSVSLWTPVAFGCGAAIYLSLPAEPVALVAYVMLLSAGLLLLAASRLSLGRPAVVVLVLAAFALGGFAAAKLRTQAVRAPAAGHSHAG